MPRKYNSITICFVASFTFGFVNSEDICLFSPHLSCGIKQKT